MILASRLGAAQSTAGELYEMQVIAAVVLGGTLLTGGVGHMPGTLFGVFTMSMITNIFNMQGNISTWWQNCNHGIYDSGYCHYAVWSGTDKNEKE